MLWVIQQRLIAKHGFSDTLLPPVPDAGGTLPPNDFYRPRTFNPLTGSLSPLVPKHGNSLSLQLVLNGMKMQPCSPTFFDARDAIIEADKVLTDGENVCDIWQGFAERGLGVDAEGGGYRTNVSHGMGRCWLEADVRTLTRVSRFQFNAVLVGSNAILMVKSLFLSDIRSATALYNGFRGFRLLIAQAGTIIRIGYPRSLGFRSLVYFSALLHAVPALIVAL